MNRVGLPWRLVAAGSFLVLVGCGGGGSGSPGGGGGTGGGGGGGSLPEPSYSSGGRTGAGTAQFHVDLAQGTVDVTPLSGSATSRAVFGGAAVSFTSQLVLDQPGSNGLRQVNVALTNRWNVPIGVGPDGSPSGLRVVFGPFTNLTGVPDVRSQTTVSTLPGTVGGPFGVAVGADGTVYATSFSNVSVMQLSGGTATKLAGTGSPGNADGLGAAAAFALPCGLAVSPADGALYLADYNGRRIRRIDRSGKATTVAGTGVSGTADGAGNAATFTNPIGLTVGGGDLFVTDYGAGSVRRLHLSGADPTVPASWQVSTVVTGLTVPAGIAASADGTLYVAEVNANRIRAVNPAGGATILAGGGAEGGTDGPATTAQFAIPYGIAATPDGLVVSEYHSPRLRWLRKVGAGSATDPASWQVLTLAGDATATGSTDGDGTAARFNGPKMVTADPSGGAVYVADSFNHRVRKVLLPRGVANPGGAPSTGGVDPVSLLNGSGLLPNLDGTVPKPYLDYAVPAGGLAPGQSTPPQPWQFTVPSGVNAFTFTVTVEGATAIQATPEVANGAGSPKAIIATLAGSPNLVGYLDGPAATAQFGATSGLAVDGAGNVFVADTNYNVIRRLGRDGLVTTIAGTPTPGHADGAGTLASFNGPRNLLVNRDGTLLYVVDSGNHSIRQLRLTGGDPRLPANWAVVTIAGSYTATGAVDGPGYSATFYVPMGICQVNDNLLYVSEFGGNRVRRLRFLGGDRDLAANWQVDLLAGDNTTTNGTGGTTDGSGSQARFTGPSGLAAGPDGSVYVADNGNHRIRRVAPSGTVTTFAGPSGAVVMGYADGASADARFRNPMGLAIDAAGQLYVAEFYTQSRIRRVSPTGQVTTVAGGGANFDGPGSAGGFIAPVGVAVDASGTLYVADQGSVRKVERLLDTSP